MMERFLRLFRLSRDINELAALSDADFADMGVSRAEAMRLAELPDDVPTRVTRMAGLFGLDSAALLADRRVWHEVLQICDSCPDLGACQRFMAREDPEAPILFEDVAFCPNRSTFAAMAALG